MPVTLTDEQVSELRNRLSQAETNRQIAEAAAGAWNHPEHGDEAKAVWKKVYPDSKIDGYDSEQRMRAMFEKDKAERAEAEKVAKDKADLEALTARRKGVQDARGVTDEFMDKADKWMVDNNVYNYEVAVDHLLSKEPRVTNGDDGGYDSGFWNHQQQDWFKEIAADPEQWGRNEIMKTLREQDQRNRGGWR